MLSAILKADGSPAAEIVPQIQRLWAPTPAAWLEVTGIKHTLLFPPDCSGQLNAEKMTVSATCPPLEGTLPRTFGLGDEVRGRHYGLNVHPTGRKNFRNRRSNY